MLGTVLLLLIVALSIAAGFLYNRLVGLRNRAASAWSDIDVQLKQRHDLIHNLVETVKGYAAHERGTLEEVTEARAGAEGARQAGAPAGAGVAESHLSRRIGRLFAVVEAYRVVASVLAEAGDDAVEDRAALLSRCLKTGKQQLLQGRVVSAESISKTLYETGLRLAEYRGLLAANRAEARRDFHEELRRINRRLGEILAITLAKAEG